MNGLKFGWNETDSEIDSDSESDSFSVAHVHTEHVNSYTDLK